MKFLQIFLVAVFFTGISAKATQHDPAWSVKFILENGAEITRLEGGATKINQGSISYFDREFYFTKNEPIVLGEKPFQGWIPKSSGKLHKDLSPEAYQEEVGRLGSISKIEKLK